MVLYFHAIEGLWSHMSQGLRGRHHEKTPHPYSPYCPVPSTLHVMPVAMLPHLSPASAL